MAPLAPQLILITFEPIHSLQIHLFYNDLFSFASFPVAMAPPAPRLIIITSEPIQSLQIHFFYNDLISFAHFPVVMAPPAPREPPDSFLLQWLT